ncbi:MAG: hypothetical protein OXT67_05460 [Zetaproteobacteria bacterium]|nr:hypothetical protein [Zetaproteobacteria bacterium]
MNQDTLIKLALGSMFAIGGYSVFKSTGEDPTPKVNQAPHKYDVHVQQYNGNGQLDLKAVGSLLGKAKNTEEFEKLLNSKETGVNNLDLNGDGKVDYIKVEEFHEGDVRGLNLTTEPKAGEVKELATIKIQKKEGSPEQAIVETRGNPEYYGPGAYYHSPWTSIGTGLFLGYLFGGGHRPWVSPYSYGRYPSGYVPYQSMPAQQYQSYTGSRFGQNGFTKSNRGRFDHVTSPFEKRSNERPRLGDRRGSSFQNRSTTRSIRKGGFGKSVQPSPSRTRPRSFRPRSSGRGFGSRRR